MGLNKGIVVEMITAAKAAHVLIREQMDNIDDEDAEDVNADLHSAITRLQNELDESHEPRT